MELLKEELLIEKKSKFLSYLYRVQTKEQVEEIIQKLGEEHKKATHICYAYRFKSPFAEKAVDDGEPSGTAGNPMLNVLIKQDLHFILAIVIRYFGGMKLGAGGLVRAYSGSVRNALEEAQIIELEPGYVIKIQYDYQDSKQMNRLLENLEIKEKTFAESIEIIANGNQTDIQKLYENKVNYKVIGKTYIKKKTD